MNMKHDPKKYLFDIVDSISMIEDYVSSLDSWEELEENREKSDAVERRLGIKNAPSYSALTNCHSVE